MSIVVDTSVIIAVLTNEKSKSRILKITKGEELVAPSSLHWEIGNAFSAMLKRDRITFEMVKIVLDSYSMIPIRFVDVNLFASLEIASKYNTYAYDSYFLECSRKFSVPLLTLDKGLINIAEKMKIKIIEV
ncbi:MAG: type II toxin-antitoxin system VapC family toxin [Melioribacteraceae bacterium]|nr:type II toxin-antitoxin system VapC family toxin [Melioribacteraceae bacterium]